MISTLREHRWLIAVGGGYVLAVRHPERPLDHVRRELREQFLTKERLAAALLIVLLLPPLYRPSAR